MKQSSWLMETPWPRGLALLLLVFPVSCGGSEDEHPATYQYDANSGASATGVDVCANPKQGCPCTLPGEIVDCGKIVVKVGDYETCYAGSRLCSDEGVWGACVSDQAIVQMMR